MGNLLNWFRTKSDENLHSFGIQFDAFTVFVFIFFLANPIKWQYSGPYTFSIIFSLRIIAVLLWLLLAFWRYWPQRLIKYLTLFWYLALLYQLPFRTTFSLLHSEHSPSFDSFGLLGVVALAVLVNDAMFFLLTLIGGGIACFVYFACGGGSIALMKVPTLLYAGWMFSSIAFIKFIFFRNHDFSLTERVKAYKVLAGAIAHEVRGPLTTLQIATDNLSTVHGKVFSEQQAIVKQEARKILSIIDSILSQGRFVEKEGKTDCSKVAVDESLAAAILDAQFSESDRKSISVDTSTALVLADKQLLIQIFINLIKNALWAIKVAGHGHINIQTAIVDNVVSIRIIDTGIGIKAKDRRELFSPFFSKNEQGVGLGLAFCKLALKNMNGSIQAEESRGHATCFTIKLPRAAHS